ncbi:hypothetical protein G7092_02650 [Mucilaginibacter sp. HC2]|uniref:hypothetical protein n=1 Tax=Mucilaginibacter inviolabilis TaxID=2714892 RepID=UPI00140E7C3A|nr:hypothetical protein [Mucilaginibacter inviolabilis]NHA02676.1 hypothetical protein [Mucilaginibacter inviolabilis]
MVTYQQERDFGVMFNSSPEDTSDQASGNIKAGHLKAISAGVRPNFYIAQAFPFNLIEYAKVLR